MSMPVSADISPLCLAAYAQPSAEAHPYQPRWRFQPDGDDFIWLLDGDYPIVLIQRSGDCFELLRASPAHAQAAPIKSTAPQHYHYPNYEGIRIIYTWRVSGQMGLKRIDESIEMRVDEDAAIFVASQQYHDGSESVSEVTVRYDEDVAGYVAEVRTRLRARRVASSIEYCNLLPGGLTETRPGKQRYRETFWSHPDGLRHMGQNPLWWVSVGSQDITGQRRIAPGGFLGFGQDDQMNPVFELIGSSPVTGAATCDGLQDEHIFTAPPTTENVNPTGWFELTAHYRIFSIDSNTVGRILEKATHLDPGPMLAWKFQYPALPDLPPDLNQVELPGSPFYGESDWSVPVPWDRPYEGRLWTASPDPRSDIHWDRTIGRAKPGSIRLRPTAKPMCFFPGSGHTVHTDKGKRYRLRAWIRTHGNATGWIESVEMLYNLGTSPARHTSEKVGPNREWTKVETTFVARGDDAPFVENLLNATGDGEVWFTDFAFDACES